MKKLITSIITLFVITAYSLIARAQAPVLNSLNVVEKVTVNVERDAQADIATSIDVNVASAVAKLEGGISSENLYVVQYDTDDDTKKNELSNQTNNADSTAIGWWFCEVFDENSETYMGECAAAPYDAEHTVIHIRDYDIYEGALYLHVGHNRKTVEPGKTYFTQLYIVCGTDAVEVMVNVKITGSRFDLNLAGHEVEELTTANLSLNYNASYRYRTLDLPVDSLLSLIPVPDCCFTYQWDEGVPTAEFYALESEGLLSENSTANYGGFWLNSDGYVTTYTDSPAFFVEPDDSLGLRQLHVGMYPLRSIIGETLHATLYLLCGKLYSLNINLEILPQITFADCETVNTLDYTFEIVPEQTGGSDLIQADYMKDAIDISGIIGQTFEYDELYFVTTVFRPGQGYSDIVAGSNIYNTPIYDACDNGYQMTDIRAMAEDDESILHVAAPFNPSIPILTIAYCIGYKDGMLSFWQKDGVREVGDYYTAPYFIYSTEDQKKIQINLTVVYVAERNPVIDIVGETTISLPRANAEGDDYAETPYNMSSIAEALECENIDDIKWMAYNDLGQLLATFTFDNIYGYTFNPEGRLTDAESEQATFSIGYDDGMFHTFVSNGNADTDYTASIVAVYGGKGYRFSITLTDIPANHEDVNGDGTVDTQDVLGIYEYMQNASGEAGTYDVNGDGTVDTQDVLKVYETMQNE